MKNFLLKMLLLCCCATTAQLAGGQSHTADFQTEDMKIANPDEEDRLFGGAVAMDGNRAIVGDIGSEYNDQGAAYIYEFSHGGWHLQAKLMADDGALGDQFGKAVAISGNSVIIGAPGATVNGNEYQGAAYVFTLENGTWRQTVKLIDENRGAYDTYGSAVAIQGTRAMVGAATDYVDNDFKGAVYFYALAQDGWKEVAFFTQTETDKFGEAVAMDGNIAVVGSGSEKALPAAYIYKFIDGAWRESFTLIAPDDELEFGKSVAIAGNIVVIGATDATVDGKPGQGLAYAYVLDDDYWSSASGLVASDGAAGDIFGNSVAVYNDVIVVGAFRADVMGEEDQGAAYVFTRNDNDVIWSEVAKLVASDGEAMDQFGQAVAIHDGKALVGAPVYSSDKPGAVYAFSVPEVSVPVVTGIELINAETNLGVQRLQDYDILAVDELTSLSFHAVSDPINVGSIHFELQGPVSHQQTENYYPYALFGDHPVKDYQGRPLPIGEYTLTATPYQKTNLEGKAGSPLTIHFIITDRLEVESFSLIDAESNQLISALQDGDVIDLQALGDVALTVRANKYPQKTGSIKFELQGPVMHKQTENYYPYALFGDNASSAGWDYQGMQLTAGEYTLTATPFTSYSTGTVYTVSFTVIDHNNNARLAVEVYPVPTSGIVNVSHEGLEEETHLMLMDFAGNVVLEQLLNRQTTQQLDMSSFKKGFYYLKVIQQQEVQVKRIVLE